MPAYNLKYLLWIFRDIWTLKIPTMNKTANSFSWVLFTLFFGHDWTNTTYLLNSPINSYLKLTKYWQTKLKCPVSFSSVLYMNICFTSFYKLCHFFIPPPLFPVILSFQVGLIYVVSRIHPHTHTRMHFHTHMHIITWIPKTLPCLSYLLVDL